MRQKHTHTHTKRQHQHHHHRHLQQQQHTSLSSLEKVLVLTGAMMGSSSPWASSSAVTVAAPLYTSSASG